MKFYAKTYLYFTCITLFFVPSLVSFAQETGAKIIVDIPEGPKPWNNLKLNNNPSTFQFAIVTDRTGGHRPGVFPDAINKLNILQPEFVMSVGDLIEGYTENQEEIDRQWKEFNGFIDSLSVPFFYVPGNHDYTNPVLAENWKKLFGPSYYHFTYKDVLFLCLNSEEATKGSGRGAIEDEQFEYIQKTLEENQDVKWTLVFMHQPLWNQKAPGRWPDVENMLKDRKHSVFVGHNHQYVKYERNNGKYFILATTGGGSSLRGPSFGEFDHVVWITMTDEGPIIANLMLEGIWGEDVVTDDVAKWIHPLGRKFPVVAEPVFVLGDNFEEASPQIKLTNDSDVPLEVTIDFQANTQLIPSMAEITKTLKPNSVEMLDLVITPNQDLKEIRPLKMRCKAAYLPENHPKVEWDSEINLFPETQKNIESTSEEIKIDGNLEDWGKLSFSSEKSMFLEANPFSHSGAEDASFEFDVRYDEDFWYIAVNVTDDEIIAAPGRLPAEQDGVSVLLDARPLTVSAHGDGSRPFKDWMYFGQSPLEGEGLYGKKYMEVQPESAWNRTENGYTLELALPMEYFKKMQDEDWKTFRLNLVVTDYDMDGSHESKLFWKPDWRGKDNYVGSGTFFRAVDN
ncbi:metallophosphoesterase [Flexithrix dorotheae]|uniref:metallophosphoesterase n=1 Tax=Flexithrix dorotheae TaxID=70993 RepID=UPI00146AAEAF|nr:metallophosphoesterase [Flexithrix dorotheae]